MDSLPKKPSKANHPFYYYEGKGWRIDAQITIDGKRYHVRHGWYRTKQEAKNDLQNQIDLKKRELSSPIIVDASWEQFSKTYLEFAIAKDNLTGGTVQVMKSRLSSFFDPLFKGKMAKDCFKRDMAKAFQRRVLNSHVNDKNKNKTISQYLRMLKYAGTHQYLESPSDFDACESEVFTVKKNAEVYKEIERKAFSEEQVLDLICAIDDAKDAMLVELLVRTGLRIGEALALSYEDLDMEHRVMRIHKTLAQTEFGSKAVYNRTKTKKGIRDIPIPTELWSHLSQYFSMLGIHKNGQLLFPQSKADERPMDDSAFRKRLKAYGEKAGIGEVRPHDLRHTFATMLSPKIVTYEDRQARAYIMGHSMAMDDELYASHNQFEPAKALIGAKQ